MAADLEKLVVRLEAVTGRLEAAASKGGAKAGASAAAGADDPEWFDDFKAFNDEHFKAFANSTSALGGDLQEMGKRVTEAFEAHFNFLQVAARNGRPSADVLPKLLEPLSKGISHVQSFREEKRSSKQFNHLSALSEGIPFLGWVAVSPKPSPYISQMEESAQFYTNKVLKEFRESDPKQAEWAKLFIQLLKKFAAHVKDLHATGVNWNKDKPAATVASLSAGAPAAGGPPPPPGAGPPPPPPPAPAAPAASGGGEDHAREELFKALNSGSGVTAGLKKVTDDMKTHKNPELRKDQKPVPAKKSTALSPRPYSPSTFKKFNAPVAKKPPVFELQQKKWVVEHQEDNNTMKIDEANTSQSVYMFKCNKSTLQVSSKLNSIILDSCTKCNIVFTDLISTFEFTNCKDCKVQINGFAPTISIEKTDGAQVFITDKCLTSQIVSAKSSEMNICIVKEDGDLTEYPLPEQYKTVWDGSKFVTTTMDLNL